MLKNYMSFHKNNINKEFKVKKMEEKEAKEVVECAYKAYGGSYIHKYIYSSEELIKLNAFGGIISYVAVDKDGQVVGHIALEKEEKLSIYELSCAFIHPFYRGRGYLKGLTEEVIRICQHEGIKGVFVRSVTSHNYSQKSASKNGFIECALLLSRIKSLNFKGICNEINKRENLLLGYRYLKKPLRRKSFYKIIKHMDIIKEIYNNMGIKVEFKDSDNLNVSDLSESKIRVISKDKIEAVVFVDKFGNEILSEASRIINKLKAQGKKVIILRIKLNDKFTPWFCEYMETKGFIFAGIMPSYNKDDELILQYVQDKVDFENITMSSKMAQRLLNYVRNCYIDNLENGRMSV
ncbi:GNAT family N-acetyltransferase [Clostridium sp. KNHs214]|uniref:GNAT family N-acetyltransferase n=1 Tax=Clostridium sp. KNHs214 TaxID=1540257 RepID=UPI000558AD0C|nr:GNAT family N-acetyltransferase [Clostridium sp. KNHs214]